MKTLITGATLVTPAETVQADILLADGCIAAIGQGLDASGATVVNASGKYIFPGGVDAHTHITLDIDAVRGTDAFYTGTLPAAMGGTTSIVDHLAFAPEGRTLREQFAAYRELAQGQAAVDYGFHGVVQRLDAETLEELSRMPAEGYSSVKAYMTYDHRLDDAELLQLLRRTGKLGILLAVHAENHEEISRLRTEYAVQGKGDPIWHARSRPAKAEAEAVGRVLRLAAEAGDAPVYVVHLSTALGLAEVKKARAAGQRNILVETCTQYLTLTEERYLDPVEGLQYVMSPPLRAQSDVEALWQGLRDGHIQSVATDHCSFTRKDKLRGLHDFTKCPGGAPGLEERLVVLYSEGVAKGRISLEKYVNAVAAAPAGICGLYPKKGALLPGSDADLVIFDPKAEYVLRGSELHGPSDYSPFEGMSLRGKVDAVFLRGVQIAGNGKFLGQRGAGRFLRRERCMLCD